MLNFTSIRKVSVNNKLYYLHTDVLKKMPFFDDFVKNTDEEINITLDNVDDKTVVALFAELYKFLDVNMNKLECFKLFLLSDYFCIDMCKYSNNNYDKKDLVNYAIENNKIDKLEIFSKNHCIEYNLFEFEHIDFEIMNKIKYSYRIREINHIWNTKDLSTVFEIFETKTILVNQQSEDDKYYEDSVLFHSVYRSDFNRLLQDTEDDALLDFCRLISDIIDSKEEIAALKPCKIKDEFMKSSLHDIRKKIINDILVKCELCRYYYYYKTGIIMSNYERYTIGELKKIYKLEEEKVEYYSE